MSASICDHAGFARALGADPRAQLLLEARAAIPRVYALELLEAFEALGSALRYLGRTVYADELRRAAVLADVPPLLIEIAAALREQARVTREDPPPPTLLASRSWQMDHARCLARLADACDAIRSALHVLLIRVDAEDAGRLARAAMAEIPEAWRAL